MAPLRRSLLLLIVQGIVAVSSLSSCCWLPRSKTYHKRSNIEGAGREQERRSQRRGEGRREGQRETTRGGGGQREEDEEEDDDDEDET